MEDKLLQKLANIATVRQHISGIIHSADRKSINPIQKIGKELDIEFINLLLSSTDSENNMIEKTLTDVVAEKAPINFIKFGDSEDETVRPKIKTSKKIAKNNAT